MGFNPAFKGLKFKYERLADVFKMYACNKNITILISPITALDITRGFQEIKVRRLRNNGSGWW